MSLARNMRMAAAGAGGGGGAMWVAGDAQGGWHDGSGENICHVAYPSGQLTDDLFVVFVSCLGPGGQVGAKSGWTKHYGAVDGINTSLWTKTVASDGEGEGTDLVWPFTWTGYGYAISLIVLRGVNSTPAAWKHNTSNNSYRTSSPIADTTAAAGSIVIGTFHGGANGAWSTSGWDSKFATFPDAGSLSVGGGTYEKRGGHSGYYVSEGGTQTFSDFTHSNIPAANASLAVFDVAV